MVSVTFRVKCSVHVTVVPSLSENHVYLLLCVFYQIRSIKCLFQIWSRTVGLVMEDTQLKGSEPWVNPSPDLGRIAQLVVHRTKEWVKSTAGKLAVLLNKIISCTSAHQHWRVRLEMVELSDHLLARCSQSMGVCVGPLLESLVGSVNDEEPRVRERFDLLTVQKGTVSKSNINKMLI